ncbi:AMP-binding protein [Micromonospora sp. M12]
MRHARAQDEAAEELQHAVAPEAWYTEGAAERARSSIGFTHRVRPRAVRADGIEFALDRVDTTVEADLELAVEQDDESLRVVLRYRTDSFDRADVVDLAAGLGSVLQTWLSDPETPVDKVPLLPVERRRPAPRRCPPVANRCTSDSPGTRRRIRRPSRWWTTGAAQLRRAVREHTGPRRPAHRAGSGPGSLVGVLFGRSAGALAAMLAVLESGAAYVPLDPTLPPNVCA